MNWRRFLQYLLAVRKLERLKSLERTKDMAYAGKLAGADKRGWERGMNTLDKQIGQVDGSGEKKRKMSIKADRAALRAQFGKKEKGALD